MHRKAPVLGSLFIKLQAIRPVTLLKRDSNTYFLANIRKFIRAPILKNVCERLHFWKVLWERFSDQNFAKGTIDDLLRERLLKLVKIEQKCFL